MYCKPAEASKWTHSIWFIFVWWSQVLTTPCYYAGLYNDNVPEVTHPPSGCLHHSNHRYLPPIARSCVYTSPTVIFSDLSIKGDDSGLLGKQPAISPVCFVLLNFFYWSTVSLQCCVSFSCIAKWFIYICVCIYTYNYIQFSYLFPYIYSFSYLFPLLFVYYKIVNVVPCALQLNKKGLVHSPGVWF